MTLDLGAVTGHDVPRGTEQKLERYCELLLAESAHQNLIGRSTVDDLWQRHIFDSAQLLRFAMRDAAWLDVGSGAGLPGLVLALCGVAGITLVEPRRLRAEFLHRSAADLQVQNVSVVHAKVETLTGQFDVITARAVAPIAKLLSLTYHLSHPGTIWVLPKGRSAAKELEEARASWQGRFRTEASVTADDGLIVVAEGVAPIGRRGDRG